MHLTHDAITNNLKGTRMHARACVHMGAWVCATGNGNEEQGPETESEGQGVCEVRWSPAWPAVR